MARGVSFNLIFFFGGASVFVCGRSNTTVLWGGGGGELMFVWEQVIILVRAIDRKAGKINKWK